MRWRCLPASFRFLDSRGIPFDPDLLEGGVEVEWSCGFGCSMAAQPSPQTTYRWVCGAGDGDYALPDLPPLLPPPLNRKVSLDAVTGKIKTGNRSTLIDGLKAKLSCMPAASARVCPRVGQETFGDGREYIAANGFRLPLVITPLPPSSPPSTCAFGLKVPPPSFKPRDLLHILHPSFPVSCINVKYQSTNASITTLQEWVDYIETPAGDRATVNNLISLEYSDTSLASLTEPPSIVRFLSAVDRSWPASRRADNSVCPKVDSTPRPTLLHIPPEPRLPHD